MSIYEKLPANIDTMEKLVHEATKPCLNCGCKFCEIIEKGAALYLRCVDCDATRKL